MKQVLRFHEGDTTPRKFKLTVDGIGENLLGATVTAVASTKHSLPIDLTGDVTIVEPASDGIVELRPDPADFTAKTTPHAIVFKVVDQDGNIGYYPDDDAIEINVRKLP